MTAPTPVTSSSMVLARSSRTNPIGTNRTGFRSSHVISNAWMSGVAKTKQLIPKPASAATTEMNAESPGEPFVNKAMTAAATRGVSKMNQGSALVMAGSKLQGIDVLDVGRLPGPVEGDDDR